MSEPGPPPVNASTVPPKLINVIFRCAVNFYYFRRKIKPNTHRNRLTFMLITATVKRLGLRCCVRVSHPSATVLVIISSIYHHQTRAHRFTTGRTIHFLVGNRLLCTGTERFVGLDTVCFAGFRVTNWPTSAYEKTMIDTRLINSPIIMARIV